MIISNTMRNSFIFSKENEKRYANNFHEVVKSYLRSFSDINIGSSYTSTIISSAKTEMNTLSNFGDEMSKKLKECGDDPNKSIVVFEDMLKRLDFVNTGKYHSDLLKMFSLSMLANHFVYSNEDKGEDKHRPIIAIDTLYDDTSKLGVSDVIARACKLYRDINQNDYIDLINVQYSKLPCSINNDPKKFLTDELSITLMNCYYDGKFIRSKVCDTVNVDEFGNRAFDATEPPCFSSGSILSLSPTDNFSKINSYFEKSFTIDDDEGKQIPDTIFWTMKVRISNFNVFVILISEKYLSKLIPELVKNKIGDAEMFSITVK